MRKMQLAAINERGETVAVLDTDSYEFVNDMLISKSLLLTSLYAELLVSLFRK